MLSRVVYKKQRGRRLATALAAVALISGSLFFASTALAVHDTGRFQLDGDADTDTNTAGTPAAVDDWDKVCYEVGVKPVANGGGGLTPAQATALCGIGTPTTGATETAWTAEPDRAASIFTGGGSKDPENLDQWAWKNGGGLPDKDNILHSFTARYSLPDAATCPSGSFPTCELLFFGLDRLDNSGDAQNGFWFFQSKVTTAGGKIGGGTGFTGLHTLNDILVVSDFSNGGTVSTITVYTWDPACTAAGNPDGDCADANLRLQESSDSANCASPSLPAGDPFCGLVNPSTITMPWSFLDKSGTPANQALNGEFYEAGINLSAIGLAGQCFSSVLSETRSSTSTTAVLKDFVLSQLGACVPTLTTQVQKDDVNFNGTVAPGTPVNDTATITVTGASAPDDATGTVDFFLCGPNATATACSAETLSAGADKALVDTSSPANTTDGISGTSSDDVNTAANPLASGFYCFRAVADLTNYEDPAAATNTTTECFSVSQPTSVVTQLHETTAAGADVSPANNGLTITIHAGSYVKDVATVTPSSATGSVAFRYYTSLANCNATDAATTGTSAGGGTVSSGTASSSVVQFNTPGTFYWRAFFTGTGLSTDSSSICNEIVTVDQPTSVVTQLHETTAAGADVDPANNGLTITINAGAYVKDVATVTPSTATGSVAFRYYTSLTACNATDAATTGTAAGGGTVSSGTSSSTVTQFNTPGTFYWRAFFTGTGLSLDSSSICNEILQVNQFASSTATSPGTIVDGTFTPVTTVSLNTSVFDHAVVTGNALDGDPTGSVSFFICNPSQVALVGGVAGTEFCPASVTGNQVGGAVTVTPVAGSESPPQTEATSSPAVVANQLGMWCFRAVYTPDTLVYTGSGDATHGECFTVTTTSSGTSAQNWLPNDTITVSTPSGSLAGTLSITLRSSTCDGTVVYTEPVPNSGAFTATAAGATYDTTNETFTVTTSNPGTYFWNIVFTPTSSFATGFTKCETSTVSPVNDNP